MLPLSIKTNLCAQLQRSFSRWVDSGWNAGCNVSAAMHVALALQTAAWPTTRLTHKACVPSSRLRSSCLKIQCAMQGSPKGAEEAASGPAEAAEICF